MTNKIPEPTCTKRASIHPGMPVDIVLKADQPTGKLTRGVVKRILTNSPTHPRGIKVMLEDGQVGRVQRFAGPQECRKCKNRIVLHAFSDGFCRLEFDKVILIDMVSGIIPGDSDDRDAEDDEEDARAFYVGATRARHELEIITCRKMYQEKLEVSEFVPRLLAAGKGD